MKSTPVETIHTILITGYLQTSYQIYTYLYMRSEAVIMVNINITMVLDVTYYFVISTSVPNESEARNQRATILFDKSNTQFELDEL
jgi:hypothetical protein